MSSVLSRLSPYHRGGFSFFIIILSAQLIFLLLLLFITRTVLQDYCSRDVAMLLDQYLQERSTSTLILKGSAGNRKGLNDLSFVRVVSDNEQFFYTEHNDTQVDFQGVLNLDPRSSAVWITLDDVTKRGSWAIASRELDNGFVVQAGVEYLLVVDLYHTLRTFFGGAIVMALFLAATLSVFYLVKSRQPLHKAEQAVASIVTGESSGLLDVDDDEVLTGLYSHLNRLISQNRQLVQEMQQSLDNVAHDLRTPMTRLRSVAEYGLQQNSPEKLSEALSDCLEESSRVLSMLGIMMSVAEAESGTMLLQKEKIQLLTTIEDVITLYEYVADEKNIDCIVEIDPKIYITADQTRISQVWANIIDNALKYGRNSGYVKVYAKKELDSVTVLFQDNGMGISANEVDRIWERLFRGDRSRTQQGLGLGLNYVRAVVEAHGGQVRVESRLGEMSLFAVTLPLT